VVIRCPIRSRTHTLLGIALLALLAVGAGCGEPGAGVTDDGVDETPTTANDVGAEPVAPDGTESSLTATDQEPGQATDKETDHETDEATPTETRQSQSIDLVRAD